MYGPTREKILEKGKVIDKGKYYQPNPAHRKNAKGWNAEKTKWTITEFEEYSAFKTADLSNWWDADRNGYHYISVDLTPIGSNGEIRAFFPNPDGKSDTPCSDIQHPWHGYPDNRRRVSLTLLDFWLKAGVITKPMRQNIMKLKI